MSDVLQALVRAEQRIAAGEQNVPDDRGVADVLDGLIHLIHGHARVMLAGEAAAGAVTAVHGALVGDQQQAAVRITVGQTGRRGVLILVQGVQQVGVGLVQLLGGRNGLQPDGSGDRRLDQRQIVGVMAMRRVPRQALTPSSSSGVSSTYFFRSSRVSIRFLTCQCQSFHSSSETLYQHGYGDGIRS